MSLITKLPGHETTLEAASRGEEEVEVSVRQTSRPRRSRDCFMTMPRSSFHVSSNSNAGGLHRKLRGLEAIPWSRVPDVTGR